jgi:hypothetical protein
LEVNKLVSDEGQIHAPHQARLQLSALILLLAIVAIVGAWNVYGISSALSAGLALVSCGVGILAGWAASSLFIESQVLERMGAGMLPRMFVPLCIFLVLYETSPALVAAGFAYYMIAIYLCLLTVETIIVVRRLQSLSTTEGAS